MWRLRPCVIQIARSGCVTPRHFATPPPRPQRQMRQRKQASNVTPGSAALALSGLGVLAYVGNESFREETDSICRRLGDAFEDFNDRSRDFFDKYSECLVSSQPEPWLLELAAMKYPEKIPTLVLDLDKVILNLTHDSKQGWRVIKRPFADQFFKEICRYYEVVIFSDEVFPIALEIVTMWGLPVTGVLHRDFCKRRKNHYVKDISKLGRDLERVLFIDHDPEAFMLQPENGLVIRPFNGDPNDIELQSLLEFLKAAAIAGTDIRQFVQRFGGGDVDIGRRYLVHKQDQDVKVQSRRNVGRAFSAGTSSRFPLTPGSSMSSSGSSFSSSSMW